MAPIAILLVPATTFALTLDEFLNDKLAGILDTIVQFLIILAIFILIFGIFRYLTAAGDEEKVKEGRRFIIWGVVGVVLMLLIRGFINVIVDTLLGTGIENTTRTPPPL